LIKKLSREVWITVLILLFLFCLRIPYINSSPYEYDAWRQSDTESIARNFLESRFNIFFPQLNYQGPLPNYVQLELQIVPTIIAVLYKCFGYHYFLARMVPVLLFLGSSFFVYLIAKRYYSTRAAWISLLVYGILPINILYSRAIMPESAALFFFTGAFYFFTEWIRQERFSFFWIAAIFTSLAILEKVPTVFVGIPMLVMVFVKYKVKMFSKPEFYLFMLISFVPALLYYYWLQTISESTFVSGIATKHIFPKMLTSIFSQEAVLFFARELPKAFTGYILLLGFAGFFLMPWKKDFPIKCLVLSIAFELVAIVAVIQFNYYLIFFGPPLALCSAILLDRLLRTPHIGKLFGFVFIVLFAYSSLQQVRPILGQQHETLIKQAKLVENLTNKKDLIVSGVDDPSLLNATHRIGWRVTNTLPGDPVNELKYFIANGAQYFVPLYGYIEGDPNGDLRKYLDTNFPKIETEPGYYIYKLTK
jgi:4-amino-4-deoxy-L-arabinose transferase-like glycosyltransferase